MSQSLKMEQRIVKYSRAFVEVQNEKNALFALTLNVSFFAARTRQCYHAQTSDQSRLPPLHIPVTSQSHQSQSTNNFFFSGLSNQEHHQVNKSADRRRNAGMVKISS